MPGIFCMGLPASGWEEELSCSIHGTGRKGACKGEVISDSAGSLDAYMLPFTGVTLPCVIPGAYGPPGFPGTPGLPGKERGQRKPPSMLVRATHQRKPRIAW